MTYKNRLIEHIVTYAAQDFKIILIVGPRQVGKSTLLRNLFPNYPVFTFLKFDDRYNIRKDALGFLRNNQGPLILDEIQYAPELISALKVHVDESDETGQYFLTGSQNLALLKTVAESMAGRVGIIELAGMTQYELAEAFTFKDGAITPPIWLQTYLEKQTALLNVKKKTIQHQKLYDALLRGCLPQANMIESNNLELYMKSYIQTYIENDVALVSSSSELKDFVRFFRLAAALSGQEINYAHIGRQIGLESTQAKEWLGVLMQTYQWHEIPSFSRNTIKRISKKPKGYLSDTGLICNLLQIPSTQTLSGHPLLGAIFETWVYNMIHQLNTATNTPPYIQHWRTHAGAEVDLILEWAGKIYPIEIKLSANLTPYDLRGLKSFRETYQDKEDIQPALIIHGGTECFMIDKDTMAMPWNVLID